MFNKKNSPGNITPKYWQPRLQFKIRKLPHSLILHPIRAPCGPSGSLHYTVPWESFSNSELEPVVCSMRWNREEETVCAEIPAVVSRNGPSAGLVEALATARAVNRCFFGCGRVKISFQTENKLLWASFCPISIPWTVFRWSSPVPLLLTNYK